jgi:hypothetical protein
VKLSFWSRRHLIPLIDSTVWLAGKLLKHPTGTRRKREALANAMVGLARLPRTTPGLTVDFGFSVRPNRGDLRYWSVHFDETELTWSVGGCIHGPCGSDSFTSFHVSLLRGSQGMPVGNAGAWLEFHAYLEENIEVQAHDASNEDLWRGGVIAAQ